MNNMRRYLAILAVCGCFMIGCEKCHRANITPTTTTSNATHTTDATTQVATQVATTQTSPKISISFAQTPPLLSIDFSKAKALSESVSMWLKEDDSLVAVNIDDEEQKIKGQEDSLPTITKPEDFLKINFEAVPDFEAVLGPVLSEQKKPRATARLYIKWEPLLRSLEGQASARALAWREAFQDQTFPPLVIQVNAPQLAINSNQTPQLALEWKKEWHDLPKMRLMKEIADKVIACIDAESKSKEEPLEEWFSNLTKSFKKFSTTDMAKLDLSILYNEAKTYLENELKPKVDALKTEDTKKNRQAWTISSTVFRYKIQKFIDLANHALNQQ